MTSISETSRMSAHEWRARIDDDDLSETDRRAFEQWMAADAGHRAAFAEAEILWHKLGEIDYADMGFVVEPQAADSRAGAARGFGRSLWISSAVAASLIALFAFDAFRSTDLAPEPTVFSAQTLDTGVGELLVESLVDGSTVSLGAQTQISVDLSEHQRTATLLAGSAYFEIVPDPARPFVVQTGTTTITVVGTAFEVRRENDVSQIAVAEGRVAVTQAENSVGDGPDEVELNAGESVAASSVDGLGETRSIPVDDIAAWRVGRLIYRRATIGEIVADLNRYSAIPISVDPIVEQLRLSGTFDANVDELLATLEAALPVRVHHNGDAITIVATE